MQSFLVLHLMVVLVACGQGQDQNKSSNNQSAASPVYPMKKSDQEWKEVLTSEQYYILREKGTEKPFSGRLLLTKEKGIYKCSACGNPLFSSEGKFDAHCGWPSFDREISAGSITTAIDHSHGMMRTEIMCAKCGGHLGHVFDDGPTKTGKRYCVNSISLEFIPEHSLRQVETTASIDTITLGGGCFWCVEAIYRNLEGVISVESGYSGGSIVNPTYEQVSAGTSGHAEVVQITFDKKKTSLEEILKVFFTIHDPTTLNQQGADKGPQYRSVIFFRNENQKKIAQDIIDELQKENVYNKPILTLVESFNIFYKAEDYHQNYYQNNKKQPYCQLVIQPKIEKFEKIFSEKLKKHL